MNLQFCPISRKSELVIQELGGEILIYDLRKDKAYSLNHTSALVWQMCDGTNTVSEIAKKLSLKLNSEITEDFIWLAIGGLEKEHLLEKSENALLYFEGLSRREMVRKVGFATMVTLPVISSLVAPNAIHARSGCTTGTSGRALGCPCTAISQCQPPASRCCLSSPGAPNNQTCVVTATVVANGGVCGNSCSCISNCCAGGLCVAFRTITAGNPCSIGCQCTSGSCSGGTCAP